MWPTKQFETPALEQGRAITQHCRVKCT